MNNGNTILLVDDDENVRRVAQIQLEEAGYQVAAAGTGEQALALFSSANPALVITDLRMPGISGLDLLKKLRAGRPDATIIVITAYGTVESAVEAMRAGAYDYISKPIDYDQLTLVVKRALERHELIEEVHALRSTLDAKYGFESIIGRSPALLRVLDLASRAARSDSNILIRGETGTGKELLAKAIHRNSFRKDRPFVTINCGAIPKDLLESELFGHTRGSFTGAVAHKTGKVELADRGTLFFDEIGEMPPELQVKLLRLLQEGEVEKVGAGAPVHVDVRIVAATHRNLRAMIEDGAFREDLYYRLAVIPLEVPPLRDRPEDIPDLVQRLFAAQREKNSRSDLRLPSSLLPYFCAYRWPGNVRELENVLERLVVLSAGDEVTLDDLPEHLRAKKPAAETLEFELPARGISLEAHERDLILRTLKKFYWNQSQAARYLDISRRTLAYRMAKHGIERPALEGDGAPDWPSGC